MEQTSLFVRCRLRQGKTYVGESKNRFLLSAVCRRSIDARLALIKACEKKYKLRFTITNQLMFPFGEVDHWR